MFLNLQKRIVRYIIISSILFTTVIGILSFIYVSQSLYNNFKDGAIKNIDQSIKNSQFTIETVKSTTIQISENNNIIETISEDRYNNQINPILNTLKNTSFGILGVTLYTTNGYTYSTSNISAYVPLEELTTNPELNLFFQSDELSFLSIRTTEIAGIYNHVKYDPSYGMITYIVKLFGLTGGINGYLFVDINPGYIYNHFFTYENYENFKDVETFITAPDGTFLKSEQNSLKHSTYISSVKNNETRLSDDRHYLLVSKSLSNQNANLVSVVPLQPLYQDLTSIGFTLLATIIALNIVSILVAIKISKSITKPLTKLHHKMSQTDIHI